MRGEGASDGTFKHTEYFKCDPDCAMFVAMDKMSNPDNSNAISSHETVQRQPSQTDDAPLKLGDPVIFFSDNNDTPMNGVVRWIGRNRQIMPNIIVGIETVSSYTILNI